MDNILSRKSKFPSHLFSWFMQENLYQRPKLFYSSSKIINFDTLYDTVSKIISTQKLYILLVFWKTARDSPVSGRSFLIDRHFFI